MMITLGREKKPTFHGKIEYSIETNLRNDHDKHAFNVLKISQAKHKSLKLKRRVLHT